mmetsp:Transcript_28205/g.86186  ORF Transcript_28205/g.86186 Transcript_28205/m.86186 type:complete len:124 (+) Transcript_28205:822-1193(+)
MRHLLGERAQERPRGAAGRGSKLGAHGASWGRDVVITGTRKGSDGSLVLVAASIWRAVTRTASWRPRSRVEVGHSGRVLRRDDVITVGLKRPISTQCAGAAGAIGVAVRAARRDMVRDAASTR